MIKSFYEYTSDKIFLRSFSVFTQKNCDLFLDVEKKIIGTPIPNENNSLNEQNYDDKNKTTSLNEQNDHAETVKKFKESKEIYQQMLYFFSQYKKSDLFFFEFKSKLEILTSTPFASFIKNAFFYYKKHTFVFNNFIKPIHYDNTKQFSYYALDKYSRFLEPTKENINHLHHPQHYIYPDSNSAFLFCPSKLLPKKIAALRFLTHHACSYLSQFQKSEYFPKLGFSCGFAKIPSELLINFILFSIFPNSNDFFQYLKLNNKNFIDILKFTNFISPSHSKETLNNTSINNNHFEYITFFSIVLSSKIRFLIAQKLLLI